MADPIVAQPFPFFVDVEEGKTYKWCACGRSATQPFCDSSHVDSGIMPIIYTATKSKRIAFCGCKASKRGAICDNSHKDL